MNEELKCIKINWKSLGAQLACLTDAEQNDFLTAFADEMNSYPTNHQRDMQLTFIADYSRNSDGRKPFTKEQREVFEYLGIPKD